MARRGQGAVMVKGLGLIVQVGRSPVLHRGHQRRSRESRRKPGTPQKSPGQPASDGFGWAYLSPDARIPEGGGGVSGRHRVTHLLMCFSQKPWQQPA